MTVKELIETNDNTGKCHIRIFDSDTQDCIFKGKYKDLKNTAINQHIVHSWSFIPIDQINAIQWLFQLDIYVEKSKIEKENIISYQTN